MIRVTPANPTWPIPSDPFNPFLPLRKIIVTEEESRLLALSTPYGCQTVGAATNRYPRTCRAVSPLRQIIAAACCAFAFTVSGARADDTLSFELPPSAEAVAQRAAEQARRAADRVREAPKQTDRSSHQQRFSASSPMSRTSYASRGQTSDNERVVGRLGQIEHPSAIHRSQSSRSARLSTVPTGTYLAIQSEAGNWYGILMSDGSLGWIQRHSIHLLDYQVVSNGFTQAPQSGAAVGDYSDGLPSGKAIYFRGDPQSLFREAYRYLGIPYHFGGNGASGIDCSAFVMNVFQACGYPLPRHSSDQTAYGLAVSRDQLQPGDRLYFGNSSTRNITHTGLYLGSNYFIHASSNSHAVAISQLSEPLYERMYICARR